LDTLGVGYNVYVVPGGANGPSFEQLQEYETVVWYTASQYGGSGNVGTVSSADEIVLKGFLDQGDRNALLFANSYIDGLSGTTWTESTNSFLTDYIGAVGGVADVLNNQAFTATGVTGTVTAGTSFNVAADTPITTYTDVVNPAQGTDTLLSHSRRPRWRRRARCGGRQRSPGRRCSGQLERHLCRAGVREHRRRRQQQQGGSAPSSAELLEKPLGTRL
jgi:hypothetical protein